MKKLIFALSFIVFTVELSAQSITRYNLVFESGQIQLSDSQKEKLDSLSQTILDNERILVHPLTIDSYYQRYFYANTALKQAEAIAKYANTIGFELLGTPKNFPSSYKGYSVSVDLKYHKPKTLITAIIDPSPPDYSLQSHYPPKASQFFIINPNKDTLIIGKEGTQLLFKAGCLNSKEEIKIELKEFYKLEDYIKNGIPTVSNGDMIQTGGSIYLNAINNNTGEQVDINPKIGVDIGFNSLNNDPEMEIFIKDPRSQNEMNWIRPQSRSIKEGSWQMTETVLNYDGSIKEEKVFTSKKEWESYLAEKAEKRKQEEERKATGDKIYNKLNTINLGYINCDKFYNEPMINLNLLSDKSRPAVYYLVYKNVRGVINGVIDSEKVNFRNVPRDLTAILIAVSFQDEKAYYFETTLVAGSANKLNINLRETNESYINQRLALLK